MKRGIVRGRRATAATLLLPMAVVLGGAISCAGKPRERPIPLGPVDSGPGTLTAARKFLQGRWTLESFEVYPPGKPPVALNGSGTLVYDDMGNLRMEIRADEKSADLLRAAGIDIRDGVISTEGRTAIDLQNRTLTYVLEGQAPLVEGPLGMRHPRHWVVDAENLTLTTKGDAGQTLSVGRWKRTP
jgi:hypothetical protein